MRQWRHVFLFILNQIYLVAKSRVSWGSPLFRRLLITHCKSSKWELKGQSFNLLGLPLEEKKEAGCQTPGWEMGGLEADFLLQIKGGPFAYSGFFFHAKYGHVWMVSLWGDRLELGPGGSCGEGVMVGGRMLKHFISPGVPSLLGFGSSDIEVS